MKPRMYRRGLSVGAGAFLVMLTTACPEETTQSKARTFTLTMSTAGAGTGSVVSTPQATSYTEGASVTLLATPSSASNFLGWSGDCTGVANPCAVIMSDNRTVTATFSPSTGVGQYDGSYAGKWSGGQSNGSNLTSDIALQLANGAIQGTLGPISGSVGTFSGTVSSTGAISATIASGPNGCAVSLTGQATTVTSGGATTATITGAYTLLASPTCKTASGSWTVARK